ncbi:MAG: PAS domain-containing protein, partial [Chitinophagaceae bacterium]
MNTHKQKHQYQTIGPVASPNVSDVPAEQSQYLLSLLLNNTDESVIMIDAEWQVILFNHKALGFLQTFSQIPLTRGLPFLDLVEAGRKDLITDVLHKAFQGFKMDIELPVLYSKGCPTYLVNQFKPVYNSDQQIAAVMVSTSDITGAKLTEQALKVSEDRWKFALNGSNHGLWDWDLKTGKMFFSDSFRTLHGFSSDEGDHYADWSHRVHPDDKEAVAGAIKTHLEGKDPYYESVYRISGNDGQYKWIHARGLIVDKDETGTPLSMIGTHTDITIQKNAEESYKILFYSHPLPMFTYELDSLKIREVNDAAIKFYDYSRSEFLNLCLRDIRPPEDAILLDDIMGQLKDHSKGMRHLARHLKKNGEIPFVEVTGSQINFEGKKSRIVTVYDVTEKIKAEQQLKTSEKQYRLLFKSNPLPSWIYDVETLRFLAVNDAAISAYGYSREEFLNRTLLDLHPAADAIRVQTAVAESKQIDNIVLTKWEQVTKDGSRIYVNISGTKIAYYGKPTRLVVANDITTMVLADEALAKSNERFKLATRATSDAIYDLDVVNHSLTWGEGMTTLFNHPAGNSTIADWENLIHPDDRDRVLKSLTATIEHTKKKFWKEEYRFQRKDKSYRHIIDKGFLKRDESGKAIRIIGAMQDISEFKTQQEELVASNDRYKFASLATSDIIWDWNLEKGTILWSDNFTKVLGHPLPDNNLLPESFCQNHFHPDDIQRVWKSLQHTINDPALSIFQEDFR